MQIHVIIDDVGGKVRTVPTDFVTASQIVCSAKLAGKMATIVPWTRSETRLWTRLLDAGEALVASIRLFEGTCPCTVKPGRGQIKALIPGTVIQSIGSSDHGFLLEPLAPLVATVPPGIDPADPDFEPPNAEGFARESNDE